MHRKISKHISSIIIFLFITSIVLPNSVYAAVTVDRPTTQDSNNSTNPQRTKTHTRLQEMKEKRDQHTKYYINSDGTITAETSINSRHYKDKNGQWQDISNKVVSSNEPGFDYSNEANYFHTHFAKNSTSQNLAMLKLNNNQKITWSLEDANHVDAAVDTYSVTYSEILSKTDLQYQPFSDGLKENIILKDSTAPNTFKFDLKANGLNPVQQKDGSIALQDSKSGEIQFVIPKPYMFDNNKQVSQNVSMKLESTQSQDIYTVTIIADSNWLSDSARAYPITIDPSVTTQNYYTQIGSTGIDTYIAQGAPDTQYYNNTYMTTGFDQSLGATRALVKFAPSIPAGAIVTDAVLSLYKYTTTNASSETLLARRITSDWPYSVTWSSQPTVDSTYDKTEASTANVSGSYTGWVNFNVWSIVKGWINGSLPNYGFMIQHNVEGDPLFFYYSSNSSTGYGPLLSITYSTDEIGVNPYWGYANTSIGSVNTYNGNFITSTTDFSLPGRGIPISIARTYNSRGSLDGIFGQKWFSNLDMQLQLFNWGAVLIDSNGTERPFMLKSDGTTYTSPDNYPVQLYKDTSGGTTVYRVQQANSETGTYQSKLPTLTFAITNSSQPDTAHITQLDDGKGNSTKISWGTSSIVITDASGRTATLSLNADGTVNQILTSAELGKVKASYTYSNKCLTSVTYDNGSYASSTVNYEWNGGLLNSLTDKNGNKSYINYNNNQVISVGAANLMSNPSFESSPDNTLLDNWQPYVDPNDNGSITQTSTIVSLSKYGKNSIDIQSSSKSGTTGNMYLYAAQQVPVKPGTSYNLSSFIKTYNLGGSSTPNIAASEAFLNVEQLDASGNHISWLDNRSSGISGTTDWTRSSLNVTTASNTAYIKVYLEVQHDSTHFGGDAYFDGVQLEQGSSATNFEGHTDFRYGSDSGAEAVWVTTPAGELLEYKNDNYGTPIAVINDPRDSVKPKSETDLSWDASDHLRSLTTPNQVNLGSGKSYSYSYDPVGDLTKATDPLNRTTQMDYYYNHLSKLTQADGTVVQNVWDPVNLNLDTDIDQTLNSKAYSYDSGNVTTESNLLGIADNRVINSGFEQFDSNKQPLNWYPYTPSGTQVNKVEYSSDVPNGGSNVLHINPGTNSNAYQWSDYIPLGSLDTFAISGYIKTGQTGTTSGACLNVYWYDSNKNPLGDNVFFNVRNTQWKRYITTIQPPSGAAFAKVMAITYGAYDGYFDDIQFEKSQLARGYNLIEDCSFERGAPQWSGSDGYSTIINDSNAYTGDKDAQVSLPTTGSSYFSSISFNVNPGQFYTLLGMLKTSNIVKGSGSGGSRLHVYFYDSSGNYVNDYVTQLITGTTDWTKYVLPFTPPPNSATLKVRLEVANASGTANFDNIRLSFEKLAANGSYDGGKNYLTSTTDQLGNTVNFQPDAYGQNLKITSPGQETVNYGYDGQEHLRTVTDNAGNTTTYNLDSNGNILSTLLGTSYNSMTFTYDRHNNLTSLKDADNDITNFKYDEDGRLTSKTNPSGSTISASYDGYGNGSQITLSTGETYNYSYDLEGNLTQSSVLNGQSMLYGYNEVGNLTSYTERDGSNSVITSINSFSYSPLDQLLGFNFAYKNNSSIAFSFDYNRAGLVNSVTGDGKKFNFTYDESNNLVSKVNPNNTSDNFTYNEAGQITEAQTIDSNNNEKFSSKYTYNSDGKITQITGNGPGNPSATYIYNNGTEKLNRLTQATINDGVNSYTFNYSYDPAGNILTMDTPSGTTTPNHSTFTYDADNRITNSGFAYDANGNITQGIINGKTYKYTYDAANRLTAVKDGNGNTIATYAYNADGTRLSKTVNGVTTTYHYFNGSLFYETSSKDPANVIHALYIRSPQGSLEAVSLNYTIGSTNNSYYYYHYNAHGDVVAVTDGNGNIYRQYVYDPYGNVISVKDGNGANIDINNDATFNNTYTYAGYRYDQESGLYFLNSRYYAAGIGRFLTKDGMVSPRNPQTLNQYVYAGGDPANHIDPSGHDYYNPGVEEVEWGIGIFEGYEAAKAWASSEYENFSSELTGLILGAAHTKEDVGDPEPTAEDSDFRSNAPDLHLPSGGGNNEDNAPKPTKNNYRKLYKKKNPGFPEDWQVHHTLPQKYAPILEKEGINIHENQYLEGVDPEVHSEITNAWRIWDKSVGGQPTAQDVINFANKIDEIYNKFWYK